MSLPSTATDSAGSAASPAGRWYRPALGSRDVTHGIYIEIALLAVILALEGKRTSDRDIVTAVFGALVAVVLAELYLVLMLGVVGVIGLDSGIHASQSGSASRSSPGSHSSRIAVPVSRPARASTRRPASRSSASGSSSSRRTPTDERRDVHLDGGSSRERSG